MHTHPPLKSLDAAPGALFDGHLWIMELIDGLAFRFRMQESGLLEFGGPDRVFESDRVPLEYRHAVRMVQDRFERDRFRDAVETVDAVTFLAVAVGAGETPYDWAQTPSVFGTDVWNDDTGEYLSIDTARRVFKRVEIPPINTIAREVRGRDFDPDTYDIPLSEWRDGPAVGVVLRDKTGSRAALRSGQSASPDPRPTTLDEIGSHISDPWLERVVEAVATESDGNSTKTIVTRALERLAREGRLPDNSGSAAESEFRAAVTDRVNQYLRE